LRKTFREWYPPGDDELKRLWADAVIILDSNVLLGLYQYPPSALKDFLAVLDRLRDRVWLPHQVGLEFHRNREGRIPEQRLVLDRLMREIDSFSSSLDSLGLPEFHPTLDIDSFERRRTEVKDALGVLAEEVLHAREKTPELSPTEVAAEDSLFDRITEVFDTKVGAPFSSQELLDLKAIGAQRYEQEIPPGFKDRDKDERVRYNDLFIWKQILRMGAGDESQVARASIFVTNDRKDDWWRRKQGVILGPRTELIREYIDETGESFHMYTPSSFLQAAQKYLMVDVSAETIEDVRRISSASRVAALLRFQRMVLPDPSARISALTRIYDSLKGRTEAQVEDVNSTIRSLGGQYASGYVATPLFFSLISDAYGPVRIDPDVSRRLRDRRITGIENGESREAFIKHAHAAWLAQALYRLRSENLTDDEIVTTFFGDDPPGDAIGLLEQAREDLAAELAQRGVG
jgi:hypothetical protein